MTTYTITTTETTSKLEKPLPTYGKYKFYKWEFETPIKWINVVLIAVWHAVSIWALFAYPFWNHWGLVVYGKYIYLYDPKTMF